MAKLNMLVSQLKTGYLENGFGDYVEYLYIPEHLNLDALRADVRAGAVQFKECLEAAEKGLSRVVTITSNSKEDALMAVSYLAGTCINDDCNDLWEEDFRDCNGIADHEAAETPEHYKEREEDCEEYCQWEEDPRRIPVISFNAIYDQMGYDHFSGFNGNQGFLYSESREPKKPYWYSCTSEAVCIYLDMNTVGFLDLDKMTQCISRFSKNKNVYMVIVQQQFNCLWDFDLFEDQEQDETHPSVCAFVLENTADLISVNIKEEQILKYRIHQFDGWMEELEMHVSKGFPKKSIVSGIVGINREGKSELICQVLKYVQKNMGKDKKRAVTKEDFKILSKFKAFSITGPEKNPKKNDSSEKLEKELIGMENVKQQVRDIVSLMKYNKCREELGIGKSNFHNVHLLIGAPGTAKTTVAKLMGNMMCEQNLLKGNRFVSVNGADLKGMFVGHSAPKTKMLFENYDIILIDEAYSLMTEGEVSDSFSQEAMAQLIIELEEHAMDKLVMFAGYGGINVDAKDNRMKKFIDANPGIKSRINSTIFFESYTPEQMVEIVHCQAKTQKYLLSHEADECMKEYFAERVRDQNFGNGREARSLLENATMFAAARVMHLPENKRTKKSYQTILASDMERAVERLRNSTYMQEGQSVKTYGFKCA